jgi:hypothetical protein
VIKLSNFRPDCALAAINIAVILPIHPHSFAHARFSSSNATDCHSKPTTARSNIRTLTAMTELTKSGLLVPSDWSVSASRQ